MNQTENFATVMTENGYAVILKSVRKDSQEKVLKNEDVSPIFWGGEGECDIQLERLEQEYSQFQSNQYIENVLEEEYFKKFLSPDQGSVEDFELPENHKSKFTGRLI